MDSERIVWHTRRRKQNLRIKRGNPS